MKRQLELIFPERLVTRPVIYELSRRYPLVVFNIRRAKVTEKTGELVLELSAKKELLDKAIKWLKKKGIIINSVDADVLAG